MRGIFRHKSRTGLRSLKTNQCIAKVVSEVHIAESRPRAPHQATGLDLHLCRWRGKMAEVSMTQA
jgi:hypothetical protein